MLSDKAARVNRYSTHLATFCFTDKSKAPLSAIQLPAAVRFQLAQVLVADKQRGTALCYGEQMHTERQLEFVKSTRYKDMAIVCLIATQHVRIFVREHTYLSR